jgi:hypothetical protein
MLDFHYLKLYNAPMTQKVQIGDIVEVPTKKGLAYVQFSHYHEAPPPHMGALIRVLPGFFQARPKEFQTLADQKELYYTFIPLRAFVNRKIFLVVGHAAVPLHAKSFPLFRCPGLPHPQTGNIDQWWLWDGTKSWRVGELTDEQLDLSIQTIWNDVSLISRIEEGWTPRYAAAFVQAARLRDHTKKTPGIKGVRHFLLFKNKSNAEQARKLAENAKFDCEVIDTGSGFMLAVRQGTPLTDEYLEHVAIQLTEIASKTGGTYDAWETAL